MIDGDGNCHVYVDASADLVMAADIVVNAKMQRPSVCCAMTETLLVHEAVARVPARGRRPAGGVELVGDAARRPSSRPSRWPWPARTTGLRSS